MRGVSLAILLVTAVVTVLAFSLRSLQKERESLREGIVTSRQADVRAMASDLEDRLRDLEENARVIETLVERTYDAPGSDRREQTRTLRAWFTAMATVIRHYSTLTLIAPGGGEPLVAASDPGEDPDAVRALIQMSRGPGPRGSHGRGMSGPATLPGGRVFYFYRFAAGLDEVVLSIEGSSFLQSAFPSVESGIIVTDPWGLEWSRRSGAAPFDLRPATARSADETRWSGPAGAAWLTEAAARKLGVPFGLSLAVWASAQPAGAGAWRVLLVRPARYISGREKAVLRQVILMAGGLLMAVGVVGTLIVRQQRYSAALAERLRNAEALRSLERQLISAEKLATTGVLAAGIAHEVGTPLGIIRARAELLLDDIDRDPSRRALEAIVAQIDRISSIIRQVLDFSRVQPVELGRVDVGDAVRSALDLLGHRLRQQNVTAAADIPPDLPAVAADASQFQQVLINLVLNACDACESGGHIQISASAADQRRVRLEIRDTGVGIEPAHLLAVFDPFFTTKKRGEGTGLGLPIAASIVRNHGGEISLASTPGQGTTVTISWPVGLEAAIG
jgi:signal transduction histidine kinase